MYEFTFQATWTHSGQLQSSNFVVFAATFAAAHTKAETVTGAECVCILTNVAEVPA